MTNACEWARDRFASFGIDNARIEQWGEFPVGFDRGPWFGRVIAPEPRALEFMTRAWTAGTKGAVRGKAVLAPKDKKELDEAKEKGTIAGAWVLIPRRGWRRAEPRRGLSRVATQGAARRQGGGDRILFAQRSAGDFRAVPDFVGQAADTALGDSPSQAV